MLAPAASASSSREHDVLDVAHREQQVHLAAPAAIGEAAHDRHHRRDADAAGDQHDALGLVAREVELARRAPTP